jgi:hypothetical protein
VLNPEHAMQIQNSNILLASRHQITERTEVKASLDFWTGDAGQQPATATSLVLDKVRLSTQSQQLASSQKANAAGAAGDPTLDSRLQMLTALVERMTGHKIKIFSAQDIVPTSPPPDLPAQASLTPPQPGAGYGLAYDYHETRYQSEQTTLSAQGVIKTADGKEIHFSLNLEMSHESLEQTDVSVRAGDAVRKMKDPLVVNFGGHAAQLTDTKFAFDIDSDGKADRVSFLKPGSGFLALDRNGDGKIDNGRELFGATSGNGFKELAAHDQDHNGFIDANDSIFSKLKLLLKDGQGLDVLTSLADKGIGALYLGNAATPFNLTGTDNALNGQTKSSGIYVKEDGSVGSVQQIDLAV